MTYSQSYRLTPEQREITSRCAVIPLDEFSKNFRLSVDPSRVKRTPEEEDLVLREISASIRRGVRYVSHEFHW